MSARFRPISYVQFQKWMTEIGFVEAILPNVWEHVWLRPIRCSLSPDERFQVRVFSTISRNTGMTRAEGTDAIRVQVFDTVRNRPAKDFPRVLRTEGAHNNTIERARAAYGYVSQHPEHFCACGCLMVERKGSKGVFFGCTGYPACKMTKAAA